MTDFEASERAMKPKYVSVMVSLQAASQLPREVIYGSAL